MGLRMACFQHRAAKAFPNLDLSFQVPSEKEADESFFESKADPRDVFGCPPLRSWPWGPCSSI